MKLSLRTGTLASNRKRVREVDHHQSRKTMKADSYASNNTSYGRMNCDLSERDVFFALVFEELNMDNPKLTKPLLRQWNKKNRKGTATHVDKCLLPCRQCIHIVYPSPKQVYFASHLESTPHYSISIESELLDIIHIAVREGVPLNEYLPNQDYTEVDNFIVILNTTSQVPRPGRLGPMIESTNDPLQDRKYSDHCFNVMSSRCVRRSMYSQSLGFQVVNGKGWWRPYPFLNPFTNQGMLSKPAISGSLNRTLREETASYLNVLGLIMTEIYGDSHLQPYPGRRRNYECGIQLLHHLSSIILSLPVYFEGCTVGQAGVNDNLRMHVDSLNDGVSKGYEKTAVLSLWNIDPTGALRRTTVIGYSRKGCGDYMQRLFLSEKTMWNGYKSFNLLKRIRLFTYRTLK
jgi:hypothetical protein